ncbi:hypothetical protein EVAR_12216_1 [Eumeta japonica]|uniref:Uncharacterized protein n=1 Tax=Eumeta variegata TaxID=151549 RepID=A0A4C1UIG8_EUMVA|nr:hypothetical protein EVAR_12216_1 [Eumeta japonica]
MLIKDNTPVSSFRQAESLNILSPLPSNQAPIMHSLHSGFAMDKHHYKPFLYNKCCCDTQYEIQGLFGTSRFCKLSRYSRREEFNLARSSSSPHHSLCIFSSDYKSDRSEIAATSFRRTQCMKK